MGSEMIRGKEEGFKGWEYSVSIGDEHTRPGILKLWTKN